MCDPISGKDPSLMNIRYLREALSKVLNLLRNNKEGAMDQSLSCIMEFFSVNRAVIGYLDDKTNSIKFIHDACSEGIEMMPTAFFDRFSDQHLPWWTRKIKEEQIVNIPDVNQMPGDASIEQELMKKLRIQSHLTVPTYIDGNLNGFIGLDSVNTMREWNALDVENLRVFSEVLSLAIEQERTKEQLKQSVEEALNSDNKFRLIFEKLPLGVEVYDKDGRLIDINPADMKIFGITKEKALGSNLFTNPNVPEKAKAKIRKGKEADMQMLYDFDMAASKGYYDWKKKRGIKYIRAKSSPIKNSENEIVGHLFLVEDNTESHMKNEQIKTTLAKLQIAVDTGDAFLWDFDFETGELNVDVGIHDNPDYIKQLEDFNHRFADGNSTFIKTIHPDDYEKVVIDGFQRIANGEIDSFNSNFRRVHEGKTIWYSCNVKTYKYNAEGKPAGIVSYMVDVTKYHETELELVKIKEADKLKSTFLANMSHEIRTPLNAIIGFSNVLVDLYPMEEAQELIAQINNSNELLLELINGVLDFSNMETGKLEYKLERIDIKNVFRNVVAQYAPKMKEGVELIFDQDSPSVVLHSDGKKVEQLISSLLSNAIKFTDEGHISLKYHVDKNNMLHVEVADTGIGIKKKDQQRIFDSFYKTNPFSQGVGLGLSIAQNIVETLGGTIGLTSEEGKGSTFHFTLPVK